jgi:hypothetical protein
MGVDVQKLLHGSFSGYIEKGGSIIMEIDFNKELERIAKELNWAKKDLEESLALSFSLVGTAFLVALSLVLSDLGNLVALVFACFFSIPGFLGVAGIITANREITQLETEKYILRAREVVKSITLEDFLSAKGTGGYQKNDSQ